MNKWMFHIDIDAFYAQVEQNKNPKLVGKPIVIGGVADGDVKRGIVSTCSYEARKYGIRSGMPLFKAYELCPEIISIKGNHERYAQYSTEFFKILKEKFFKKIEIASVDECYIDCTYLNKKYKNPVNLAKLIQKTIFKELNLTISIGISYNRYVAKIASGYKKPNNITYIPNFEIVKELLFPLKISDLSGIGSKTLQKLNSANIFFIKDLYNSKKENDFIEILGEGYKHYKFILSEQCTQGSDFSNNYPKSISKSTTLFKKTSNYDTLFDLLVEQIDITYRIILEWKLQVRSFTITLKDTNFKLRTKQFSKSDYFKDVNEIKETAKLVFQKFINPGVIYRLVGFGFNNLKFEDSSVYNDISEKTKNILKELNKDQKDLYSGEELYLINKNNFYE